MKKVFISSINGGDAYNLAHLVNLGKEVNKEDVEEALNKVAHAHPYLFTRLSNDDREEFSYSRIEECLNDNKDSSISNIVLEMSKRLEAFVGDKEQFDDVVFLNVA